MDYKYENPNKVPLHELILNCKSEKIPALSARWIEKKSFTRYVPLTIKSGKIADSFDEDEWIYEAKYFNLDLEWILGLNFHRFWSHIIFDKEFLNPLLDFFQESTPFYIPTKEIFNDNDGIVELYDKICRNALVIVCRLILNRESDEEFMTKEKHAEILYQNYLISVPLIFDMIALYGYDNKNLIQKIINGILKIEPKYMNDIKAGIKYIQSTFVTMKKQAASVEDENRNLLEKYEDLSLYLMNISVTLNIMIELVPAEVKVYCSRDLHLEQSIVSLYENLIPKLYQNSSAVDSSAWFLTYIHFSRVELINVFRNLLNRGILMLFSASEKARNKIADEVLSIFTECAGFQVFIKDYTKLYPIEMDLDVIQQNDKKIDKIKLDFVHDAYKNDSSKQESSNVANGYHLPANEVVQEEEELEMEGACALPLKKEGPQLPDKGTEDHIQLETCKILELFPDYGAGYIRRLLAFYENNSETVISKILEESVDESLWKCDKQEPFIPPESPQKGPSSVEPKQQLLSAAEAVMETFNAGKILKNGKNLTMKQPKTMGDIINDKSHINEVRDRYKQYSLISGKNDIDDENEYDDEYDDSYEVFADTEPRIHLKGKMRDVLPDEVESEESESEEEPPQKQHEEPQRRRNPMDFCENPEAIRARREREYQNRMSKKHPNRPAAPQEQQQGAQRDVVGNAKGKGQSNEVLRNRQQKGVNKSSRANHNRKAGSTFKQSRGMY